MVISIDKKKIFKNSRIIVKIIRSKLEIKDIRRKNVLKLLTDQIPIIQMIVIFTHYNSRKFFYTLQLLLSFIYLNTQNNTNKYLFIKYLIKN